MTNREKINCLKRYRQLDEEINQKIEELTLWRAKATKITPSFSDTPKGGVEDRIQLAVDKICELDKQINADVDKLYKAKKLIEKAIGTVPDRTLQTLLRYKYINGKTWDRVSVAMHYDVDGKNVYKMHGKAIEQMKMDTELHHNLMLLLD